MTTHSQTSLECQPPVAISDPQPDTTPLNHLPGGSSTVTPNSNQTQEGVSSYRVLRDMADLYDIWCRDRQSVDGNKTLWHLVERKRGRAFALGELLRRVLDHYVSEYEIAEFLELLEFSQVARCIRELLPGSAIGRSGDLGEILAAEFVEERLFYDVPIRKLRGKDHRNVAMRGEDVIGVAFDDEDRLKLLKGEAKSARQLARGTVESARARLEEDCGRPSAHSLIFVARQLIQSEDPERKELGRKILEEASERAIPKSRLGHLLFTLSGNRAVKIIQDDFNVADGTREQHVANLRIPDHGEFVEAVYVGAYEEADAVGDD